MREISPKIVFEYDPSQTVLARFQEEFLSRDFAYMRTRKWGIDPRISNVETLEGPEWILRSEGYRSDLASLKSWSQRLGYWNDALIALFFTRNALDVTVGHDNPEVIDQIFRDLEAIWPTWEAKPGKQEPIVPVHFWSMSPHGPSDFVRMIEVPEWKKVKANYPGQTQEQLAEIMKWSAWPASGKLMLWHGEPGVGKTYALRSLLWSWRDWSNINYIMDPETFFNEPSYMLNVLMNKDSDPIQFSLPDDQFSLPDDIFREEDKRSNAKTIPWRFIVLEDAGELMSADARERSGQGLSRLLNIADGLIGQGLKVCTLVTTNEPVKKLHPAIERPGRCAANIEFQPFTNTEAQAWLKKRGGDLDGVKGDLTLAKLYAEIEGRQLGTPSEKLVGFSAD